MADPKYSRRRFIRTTGIASGAFVVGCRSDESAGDEDPSTGPNDAPSGSTGTGGESTGEGPIIQTGGHGGGLRGPNILLLTADDMGWGALPAYGNTQLNTPAFDRLAAEGAVLTHAFNTSSSCSSSRATFATGQYVQTHGVGGLINRHPEYALPPEHPTAASVLADVGYRTGLLGKWHIALSNPAMYGYLEDLDSGTHSSRFTDASLAVDFIRRHRDENWFLEVNFLNTHLKPNGTYPLAEGFPVDPETIELLAAWTMPDWTPIREMAARYFVQVLVTDFMVGQLLDVLDELGLADDTLVVFVSDNGMPFPGNKKTLYDRGTGTPWLARWSSRISAGRRSSALVSTVDLAPTLLDAAGLEPLPSMQGMSALPLMAGAVEEFRAEVFSAITYHRNFLPTRAIRTPRYKLIRNLDTTPIGLGQLGGFEWAHEVCELPNQPWLLPRIPAELYDLEADPLEQANLIDSAEYLVVRDDLLDRLHQHMQSVDDELLDLWDDYVPR